jgi:hypothetical protein
MLDPHNVTSWSKIALRSSGGTNFELDLSVVEGKGSWAGADARPRVPRMVITADTSTKFPRVISIALRFQWSCSNPKGMYSGAADRGIGKSDSISSVFRYMLRIGAVSNDWRAVIPG